MVCHGVSTGGLFVLVGGLQERIHTRDLERMGGLWAVAPRLSGAVLFFSMASLGLPGIGDFVGEFLVLLGSYKVSVPITVAASLGILASTFYALRIVQRAFQGPNTQSWRLSDLSAREGLMVATMIAGLIWLGLYPQTVLNTFKPALQTLQHEARISAAPALKQAEEMSNEH
jgi:NADH-quinone oxidoreductase subunit M